MKFKGYFKDLKKVLDEETKFMRNHWFAYYLMLVVIWIVSLFIGLAITAGYYGMTIKECYEEYFSDDKDFFEEIVEKIKNFFKKIFKK